MDNKTVEYSKIWECLKCSEQWADKSRHYMCPFCDSIDVEFVCSTADQIHLLRHPEAKC